MDQMSQDKEERCSRCGSTFFCGSSSARCWCRGIQLEPEALKRLTQEYTNCLCEKCLLSFSRKPSAYSQNEFLKRQR